MDTNGKLHVVWRELLEEHPDRNIISCPAVYYFTELWQTELLHLWSNLLFG
jgi:hypothetical protein